MTDWDQQCRTSLGEDDVGRGLSCQAVLDNLRRCWPRTPANQRSTMLCSDVIRQELARLDAPRVSISQLNISSEAVAFRECDAGGAWAAGNWTNYTLCMDPLEQLQRLEKQEQDDDSTSRAMLTYISFFGSLASLVFLSAALFVFCYFRCLQCSRLSVHKNLIVALMLCNVLMIVIAEPFITHRGGVTYRDVDWLCKTILTLQMYGRLSSILWMWNEGFFLHLRITVCVFNSRAPFKLLHSVGWGLSAVFVLAWALVTEDAVPNNCWKGYGHEQAIWLVIGPMIVALGINLLFLLSVVRILVTRMRNNTTMEMEKIRKAIKATAILFPLLGITNLFFFIRPSNKNAGYRVYLITNSVLHSLQGIFVSVLYCFLNSEVRKAIRKKYYRVMVMRGGSRWSPKNSCRTSTMFMSQGERLCCRTQRWTAGGREATPAAVDWAATQPPQGETKI